uniref:ClbS/DfsB family four-helix bundle protein n=1 Tax=Thaumasiovibrio occultus TaxID=1891184 RepID=UPI000B34DFAC|nr:ClbS/DfsB family four-helix bundle protein [Thaumasiovibrio occultus]
MSSIPQNKQQLVDAITQSFEKLRADYQSAPESLSRISGVEGNVKDTQISLCDTLAYLIGWGQLVLKWHQRRAAGLAVDFPDTGFKWNQLGELATHFHHTYQAWSYADLLVEWERTITQILALISALSDEELYHQPWYEKWTFGRMIQFNTASPMKNIRTKVRRFLRQQKSS